MFFVQLIYEPSVKKNILLRLSEKLHVKLSSV